VRADLPAERAFEMSDSGKLGESLHRRNWQQPLQETRFESDGGLRTNSAESPMPEPRTSPPEDWRELAQRVQVEPDPKKMFKLVEQPIAKIDEERLPNPFRPTSQTEQRRAFGTKTSMNGMTNRDRETIKKSRRVG
jgi:hypothetical protein